jgi:hypothetical protein
MLTFNWQLNSRTRQPTTSLHSTELPTDHCLGSSLYSLWADPTEKNFQQSFYCCHGRLPSDRLDIVEVFTSLYQAMHDPSRDRCLATVLRSIEPDPNPWVTTQHVILSRPRKSERPKQAALSADLNRGEELLVFGYTLRRIKTALSH